MPVPIKLSVCGEPAALSKIETVADSDVAADGVKVSSITQELFGKTLTPFVQVVPLAIAKSPAFVPVIEGISVRFSGASPLFVTVMPKAPLLVFTV